MACAQSSLFPPLPLIHPPTPLPPPQCTSLALLAQMLSQGGHAGEALASIASQWGLQASDAPAAQEGGGAGIWLTGRVPRSWHVCSPPNPPRACTPSFFPQRVSAEAAKAAALVHIRASIQDLAKDGDEGAWLDQALHAFRTQTLPFLRSVVPLQEEVRGAAALVSCGRSA